MSQETVQALIDIFPRIIPEIILGVVACVLFLGSTFKANRNLWGSVALIGLLAATATLWLKGVPNYSSKEQALSALYAAPVWLDSFAVLVKTIALLGGILLVLLTWKEMDEEYAGEHHGCLMLIVAGVSFTASANELVTLFLALELISIPTYILLYLSRSDQLAKEASVKYFLLSIFSSALLLFGFSYLYGLAGTTNIRGIIEALAGPETLQAQLLPGMELIAVVMIIAGLGFKIAAVPFHFYAPDVYQGTTLGNAALLAFVPKVAGFVAMIRVLGLIPYQLRVEDALIQGGGPIAGAQVSTLLWILAAVTMTLGNVLALLQGNLKRLLAYSSVAHAGYMLIGVSLAPYMTNAPSSGGIEAVLFYLVSYGAMTIGAFGIIAYLSTKARAVENIDDLSGLSRSHPGIALLMALFMFSLIGMPATAGFMGKFLLFFDAFTMPSEGVMAEQARLFRILALIGAINAAIGAWYYLRIITVMYLRNPLPEPLEKSASYSPRLAAIWLCALVTLALGLFPRPLVERTRSVVNNEITISSNAETP